MAPSDAPYPPIPSLLDLIRANAWASPNLSLFLGLHPRRYVPPRSSGNKIRRARQQSSIGSIPGFDLSVAHERNVCADHNGGKRSGVGKAMVDVSSRSADIRRMAEAK